MDPWVPSFLGSRLSCIQDLYIISRGARKYRYSGCWDPGVRKYQKPSTPTAEVALIFPALSRHLCPFFFFLGDEQDGKQWSTHNHPSLSGSDETFGIDQRCIVPTVVKCVLGMNIHFQHKGLPRRMWQSIEPPGHKLGNGDARTAYEG